MAVKYKPLGMKNYGSIPHLPGSRVGPGDHAITPGQARIATEQTRDSHDLVIVTEKLDGSNVGVARKGDQIIALGRAGYTAMSSPYIQHRYFADWVFKRHRKFLELLGDGERLVGEWLAQAHGTKYTLVGSRNNANSRSPFVAFDLMRGKERILYDEFITRVRFYFNVMPLLHRGGAFSIEEAMGTLGEHGSYGAQDPAEGAVWRVERAWPTGVKGERASKVDFLTKYVRADKVDGKYFPEMTGEDEIWNWKPRYG